MLNIAQAGDHIVSSASIYGGTYNLFAHTFAKLGIEVTFIEDQDDPDQWRRAIRPNTKLFLAETIGNPRINVLDISMVAGIAHDVGVPLIADNTIATPYLLRPLEHGADIVVHSATKFLSGHGTIIAGAIIDGGTFPWSRYPDRFPDLTRPDPSYQGLSYTDDLGDATAYITKARVQLLRAVGAAVAPDNAWLLIQGIETLTVRMDRHVRNALAVAEWLQTRQNVVSVNYAGLASRPLACGRGQVRTERRRRGAVVRAARRGLGGTATRGERRPVQSCRQHRRRPVVDHPPRLHHPFPAHPRAAADRGCHARAGAAIGRDRTRRRSARGPRPRTHCRAGGMTSKKAGPV